MVEELYKKGRLMIGKMFLALVQLLKKTSPAHRKGIDNTMKGDKPTFTITRHRYAGEDTENNLVVDPTGRSDREGIDTKETAEKLDNFVLSSLKENDIDPYEAQGKDFRVHHPTQPKTQVERWEEEKEANIKVIVEHCGMWFAYRCTEHKKNFEKIKELELHISQDHEKNKTYLNRYPTGEFADDKCFNCEGSGEKMWLNKGRCVVCWELVDKNWKKETLLDKIKRLWKKK